jgi:membrane protease YdiL (CAAX protease family)
MGNDRRLEGGAGAPGPGKRVQAMEVLTFLFLIVPSMVIVLFVRQGRVGFGLAATSIILRDLALVVLIFFFAWRNGEAPGLFGWTFRRRRLDVVLALVLFLPVFYVSMLLDGALQAAGFSAPATPRPGFLEATDPADYLLAVVLVLVVAVAEETIFRGYLIRRFSAVMASPAWAVVLSSALFAIGHGYEGTSGLVTVGFMGLVFALIYLWRGSLVAPMVLHFLQDALSIVVLPLVGGA